MIAKQGCSAGFRRRLGQTVRPYKQMLRIICALLGIPVVLTLSLAIIASVGEGRVGLLNNELFELGLLPVVLTASAWLLCVFLPLLAVARRIWRLSPWGCSAVGFVAALVPVLASTGSVLLDPRLRVSFRVDQLAASSPLLVLGAVSGFLFWLLVVFRNGTLARGHAAQA